MGLFLSMSGLAGASRPEVEGALSAYASAKGGRFQNGDGPFESPDVMAVVEGQDRRITVLYPWNFLGWDDASAFLSRTLGSPVFSLHVHDGDLWIYALFVDGEGVDHFNPIPDYWSDGMSEGECAEWAGDADLIARVWPGVTHKEIRNYLVRWDLDDYEPGQAYPEDRFQFRNCFQLIDFMRKMGLAYPLDDEGQVLGESYRFEVPSDG